MISPEGLKYIAVAQLCGDISPSFFVEVASAWLDGEVHLCLKLSSLSLQQRRLALQTSPSLRCFF